MLRTNPIRAPSGSGWERMDSSDDIFFSELNSLKLAWVSRGLSVRWSLRMARARRLVSLDVVISWAVPRIRMAALMLSSSILDMTAVVRLWSVLALLM